LWWKTLHEVAVEVEDITKVLAVVVENITEMVAVVM
jgi:hypothetical protein